MGTVLGGPTIDVTPAGGDGGAHFGGQLQEGFVYMRALFASEMVGYYRKTAASASRERV